MESTKNKCEVKEECCEKKVIYFYPFCSLEYCNSCVSNSDYECDCIEPSRFDKLK